MLYVTQLIGTCLSGRQPLIDIQTCPKITSIYNDKLLLISSNLAVCQHTHHIPKRDSCFEATYENLAVEIMFEEWLHTVWRRL